MKVLVTGHSGFKGSWLALMLSQLGHSIEGLSLPPREGVLYQAANLSRLFENEYWGDCADQDFVLEAMATSQPDVVIHMAAQPLVSEGYRDPLATYKTNVIGTMNILEVALRQDSVQGVLSVTTDKVYKDLGVGNYSESSPLGGHDPYSASKVMADVFSQEIANRFPGKFVLVARAGNVIGPWDSSPGRLLPDILDAIKSDTPLMLRSPNSVRPWQFVLDCVGGYWKFLEANLNTGAESKVLNFGPDPDNFFQVSQIVSQIEAKSQGLVVRYSDPGFHETAHLTLDSTMAKKTLGWRNLYSLSETLDLCLLELDPNSPMELATQIVSNYLSRANMS